MSGVPLSIVKRIVDCNLFASAQNGVNPEQWLSRSLVVDFKRVASPEQAAKYGVTAPFRKVHYDFVLVPERAAAAREKPAKKKRSG